MRTLLLSEHRKLAGSNAVGLKCGDMTANMGAAIIRTTPYISPQTLCGEMRQEQNHAIAIDRLETMLRNDFPGMQIRTHLGGDLPLFIGNYVPFLIHSNLLYQTIKIMYNSLLPARSNTRNRVRTPKHLRDSFITLCAHYCGTLSLNINSVSALFSENLQQDTIVLAALHTQQQQQQHQNTNTQ